MWEGTATALLEGTFDDTGSLPPPPVPFDLAAPLPAHPEEILGNFKMEGSRMFAVWGGRSGRNQE